jgi:hypothetical protein
MPITQSYYLCQFKNGHRELNMLVKGVCWARQSKMSKEDCLKIFLGYAQVEEGFTKINEVFEPELSQMIRSEVKTISI